MIQELNDMKAYNMLLTEYVAELRKRSNKEKLNEFAEKRKYSMELVEKRGIFYIGNMTEMLLPKYVDVVGELGVISQTNNKPIFEDRYIIPIYDCYGLIQNLVGYSFSSPERYIYGTSKYYDRRDTLYGLENIHKAYEMGYAIVTEGITDTLRYANEGYENTFAMCGTHGSDNIVRMLDRCKYGVLISPDRDDAGLKALKKWNVNRSIVLYTPFTCKDMDEFGRDKENLETFHTYVDACIDWLHTGVKSVDGSIREEVTIL